MKTFLLKQKKRKNGFTAIEIMTVIVLLGIIVSVTLLNFISSSKRKGYDSSLMENMRLVQTMLETYKIDWKSYPDNVSQLGNAATKKKYNKPLVNPFTRVSGTIESGNTVVDFVDPTSGTFLANPTVYEGKVGYQLIDISKYYLIGYGEKGIPIEKNGKAYLVTNG